MSLTSALCMEMNHCGILMYNQLYLHEKLQIIIELEHLVSFVQKNHPELC